MKNFLCEYITGDRLKKAANLIIDPIPSNSLLKSARKAKTIWCKTDYLEDMFENMGDRTAPCVLITHNSDIAITEDVYKKKHPCIKHWFAQNVECEHGDLHPIPIGVENHKSPKGYSGDMSIVEKYRKKKSKEHLVFMNFNPMTHIDRTRVYAYYRDCDWVKYSPYGLPFEECMKTISYSKFVFCPRGNGLDTHRVWEALYLRAVPIVMDSIIYRSFDLPILIINDWKKISKNYLLDQYSKIVQNENTEHMSLSYWLRRIRLCASQL